MADRVSAGLRRLVAERARGRCEYCLSLEDYATQSFAVEHIRPKSRGGETVSENLAFACPGCNAHKYNKIAAPDPVGGDMVALFNPRRQRWRDHFEWNEDYTEIIGLTPTGRVTVRCLQMNRPGVRNIRDTLFAIGKHPPADEVSPSYS